MSHLRVITATIILLLVATVVQPLLAGTAPAGAAPDGQVEAIAAPVPNGTWLKQGKALGNHHSGNFRTICETSHYANDDPIVKPGQNGQSHLHMFWGNTGTDADSTYASLRTSGGGTCLGGPLNRSAYWMPALFDADGDLVDAERISIYYKVKQEVNGNVAELPAGLVMVGGAPDLNGYGKDSWKWTCRTSKSRNRRNANAGATIPSCARGDQVRALVTFRSCWDGVNLDSSDHRSHMAYPIDGRAECPRSHPVLLPTISYQVFFDSDGNTDDWRLSSDSDAAVRAGLNGASLHADWFGAWDPDILTQWHNQCLVRERNCGFGNLGNGERLVNTSND